MKYKKRFYYILIPYDYMDISDQHYLVNFHSLMKLVSIYSNFWQTIYFPTACLCPKVWTGIIWFKCFLLYMFMEASDSLLSFHPFMLVCLLTLRKSSLICHHLITPPPLFIITTTYNTSWFHNSMLYMHNNYYHLINYCEAP